MPGIITREPVISAGVASAVIALAAALGFHLSGTAVGVITAIVPLALSAVVRTRVTPLPPPPLAPPLVPPPRQPQGP